jgi:universal stress protein E
MQIRRILAGTDFSELSVSAVRWAARHLAADADLVLVHAIDLPQPPAFLRLLLPTPEEIGDNVRYGAEARLRELAESLGRDGVRTEVRTGRAPDVLCEAAREFAADIVVVGEHGTRKGVRGLLGTTADRLLSSSPVPVLVARDLPDSAPAFVLAPLDGSPTDALVLQWSHIFRRQYGTKVTACHAIDVLDAYGRIRTISAALRAGELEQEMHRNAQRWIEQSLRSAGFEDGEAGAEVLVGDPRYGIPAVAQRLRADLIIMGARGAGALERAVLGSVTTAILNSTSYSVLVVTGAPPAS